MGLRINYFPIIKEVLPFVTLGDMLMYGVQNVFCSANDVSTFFSVEELSGNNSNFNSYDFFKMLGFDTISALDVSDYEGADYIFNLNKPVPDSMHARFDFIYDGGTLEHVFNTPMALENGVKMLKSGGVIFHHLPMNNQVNHGFYQFSPTLFFDYYIANDFSECNLFLFDEEGNTVRLGPRDIVPLELCNRNTMLGFLARKTSDSEINYPIQSMYSAHTKYLLEAIGDSPFYIWGTSSGFKNIYSDWFNMNKDRLHFQGFIDSNTEIQASPFQGHTVYDPSVLQNASQDTLILVASTYQPEIEKQIIDMGMKFRLIR